MISKSYLIKVISLLPCYLLVFLFSTSILFSKHNSINGLIPFKKDISLYEVNRIEFQGNESFTDEELLIAIITRTSDRSFFHLAFEYYSEAADNNRVTPGSLKRILKKLHKSYSDQIMFFNKEAVESDSISLWHFYNKRGFHNVQLSYSFKADTNDMENILTFKIRENRRAKINRIEYLGMVGLPEEVMSRINKARKEKTGRNFDEIKIAAEISAIHKILLDNGYFFATFDLPPRVIMDTSSFTDDIFIQFHPGKRIKIGQISFIDSTRGQNPVSRNTMLEQLGFKSGDWYSRSDVRMSEDNLRYLGTFEIVTIDTSSVLGAHTDSSLNFLVFTQYRKLQELSGGFFINRTNYDNLTNIGVEGQYLHRNIGGKAQVFNPYVRFALRDMEDAIPNFFNGGIQNYLEYQVGLKFGQPLLWSWNSIKVGFYSNPIFSYRNFKRMFDLQTISIPIRFNFKWPVHTFVNNISFDVSYDKQVPIRFSSNMEKFLKDKTPEDSAVIQKSVEIYRNLDIYSSSHPGFWDPTALIFGVTVTSDHRNKFFSPTKGYHFLASADGTIPGLGAANFIRGQLALYNFWIFNRYTIGAVKTRIGIIKQFDSENSYVPLQRQFFAGGANSVRGWPSRRLRYTSFKPDPVVQDFVEDFIGSSVLIEATFEVRYRAQKPKGISEFWGEQLANLGSAVFIDIGNAFNWFASESDFGKTKFTDFFTKLAVSSGFGLRYETPVGPLRLDFAWPLYDPSRDTRQLVFSWDKVQIHFALGHAF